MAQRDRWEQEYQDPKLVTKKDGPRRDFLQYLKYLKKQEEVSTTELRILDLGSGTGRHANYLANLGNIVSGLEVSETAITLARLRAKALGVSVQYQQRSIGEVYDFEEDSFDMVLDIMTSNTLNESERSIYLQEVHRVLKKDGHFFIRILAKDGDKNAKNLLREYPGKEYDTYIHPDMGIVERVFSEVDFRDMYGEYFDIKKLFRKTNYARMNGQAYKRNYLLAYLQKNC